MTADADKCMEFWRDREVYMSHAERCPVCLGSGMINREDFRDYTGCAKYKAACHGCGGNGWVVIRDDPPYGIASYGIGGKDKET
jgi:DnaJ-class molecular chaperone